MSVDDRGRFYVGPTCDPWQTAVFEQSGSLIATLGKPGEGPGELRLVSNLWIGSEGAIEVMDITRAVVAFSPALDPLPLRRLNPLSTSQPVVVLDDGSTVQNAVIADPERGALPLHIVSAEHEILLSFGDDGRGYRYDRPGDYVRWLAAPDGEIWAAHLNEYEVDVWNRAGTLMRTIRRAPSWFVAPRDEDDLSASFVSSIHVDDEGRLWVLGSNPEGAISGPGILDDIGTLPECKAPHPTRDAFIEVLDIVTGEVLATAGFDRGFSRFVGGKLVSLCSGTMGPEGFDVWETKLLEGGSQ